MASPHRWIGCRELLFVIVIVTTAECAQAADPPETQVPRADERSATGAEPKARSTVLERVVVTSAPARSVDELGSPAQVLTGAQLDARRAGTIGEMLSGLAGVSASAFGPNASRPIVRGLDGDRLKILSNGAPLLDASAASPDHAVAAESLLLDRVEVLRGASALRFGGGSIGGVINLIDDRIPQSPLNELSLRADLRAGGAANESAATTRLDGGDGRLAWHADAMARRAGDLGIPGFARSDTLRAIDADPNRDRSGRLANSATQAQAFAVGASRTEADGHLGVALSQNSQRYGTTLFDAGAPISIDLLQTRLDTSLRQENVSGGTFSFLGALSEYRHAELTREIAGTEFRHQGANGRLEWSRKSGASRWLFGAQYGTQKMRVTGEESFLPVNQTGQTAAYLVVDHALRQDLRLEAGTRLEHVEVSSAGGHSREGWVVTNELPRLSASNAALTSPTPGELALARSFDLRSWSFGAVWDAAPATTFALHASHSERAPTAQELFADGVHTATATYEIGNPQLRAEQSNGLNLGWRQRLGPLQARLDGFEQRFNRFISLRGLGQAVHPQDNAVVPAGGFLESAAIMRGAELGLNWIAFERGSQRLGLEMGFDQVRITDGQGAPLPRMPPHRWRLASAWRDGNLSARLEALSAGRVNRVALDETPTPSWTRIDAWLGWALTPNWQIQLSGRNLTNASIRDHTSFLKDVTVAGGRSVLLSLRTQI